MTSSLLDLQDIVRRYRADGFVKIEPFLDEARLAEIEIRLAAYVRDIAPALPPTDVVYERDSLPGGTPAVRNFWRMEQHEPYFAALAEDPAILRLIEPLVNSRPLVSGVELFAKPALVGSIVPYHQDNAYFTLVPPDAVTCWIALDDSTLQNGCVFYARATHLQGLRPHCASHVQGNSMMAENPPAPPAIEEVPGILHRGGAILHHCEVLHRSEPNRSPRPRRGLLLVYRGSHCQTDPEGARSYRQVLQALQD